LATALGIEETQANAIYQDIANKRRTTKYMHLPPVLVVDVPEPHAHA
jgi:NAD+ synthase